VIIDGRPKRSTTGTFYLEYYEDAGACRLPRAPKTPEAGQLNTGVELEDERVEEEQDPESLEPRGRNFPSSTARKQRRLLAQQLIVRRSPVMISNDY
jgi:hypothetical protein